LFCCLPWSAGPAATWPSRTGIWAKKPHSMDGKE